MPVAFKTSGTWDDYLFGKTTYPPRGRCEWRIQHDYQLIVLTRGSLRVTVDGTDYELAPGEAILQYPRGREYYRFSDETESEHTWCQIVSGSLSARDRKLLRQVSGVHQASSAIHLLIEEGLSARNPTEPSQREAMLALARSCLLRFVADSLLVDESKSSAPTHPAVDRALKIADAHYAELHSAEDVARRVGISVSRLRSLFRQEGRESPSDMIWRLKAEHALQMIRSTGMTLGEIAETCGYANPFHLSRSFKRYTGHSPRELRREEWKG
jgi:AraC-like DNA-binding protein